MTLYRCTECKKIDGTYCECNHISLVGTCPENKPSPYWRRVEEEME